MGCARRCPLWCPPFTAERVPLTPVFRRLGPLVAVAIPLASPPASSRYSLEDALGAMLSSALVLACGFLLREAAGEYPWLAGWPGWLPLAVVGVLHWAADWQVALALALLALVAAGLHARARRAGDARRVASPSHTV